MRFATLATLAFGIIVLVRAQFLMPRVWEADGYLHIRMAEQIRQQGVLQDFHWARFSFYATKFADKDFFYHLLLVPFTLFPSIFFGAKVAAATFAVIAYLLFYYVVRENCSKEVVPAALLLFLASDHLVSAFCRPRPMVLSIGIMLLGIHFLSKRNTWGVFFTSLIYGFLHLTAPLMVFFAVAAETLRALGLGPADEPRGFSIKTVAAALGGVLLSYLCHPHFPNNLLYIWLNLFMVPYYAAKGGVLELGGEFFPISTKDFLMGYPLFIPCVLAVIGLSLVRRGDSRYETKVFFLSAIPLFIGAFTSQRYIIHEYPLALVWLGMQASDLTGASSQAQKPMALDRFSKAWSPALCVLALAALAAVSWPRMKDRAAGENYFNAHYEQVALWFRENVPPGETIFHANWSDSQYFIGLNPQNDYFVTMDPIFMYAWNPDLYTLYRDVALGRTPDPYQPLRNVFHVRYGYAGRNYFGRLIEQVSQDRRFSILAQDQLGVIFRLN